MVKYETPWNHQFSSSEPSLRLVCRQIQQNRQNTGYFAGIPGKPRYTWKIPGYRADFLNFAPDFAPDQLSDSGKLASFPRETREKQNGAPNTLWFPWKLPETQSAGDPLVSLWVAGNSRTGQDRVPGIPLSYRTGCTRRHGGRRGPPTGCALLVLLLLTRDSDRLAARWTPYSTGDLSRLATFLRLLTSSLSLPRAH